MVSDASNSSPANSPSPASPARRVGRALGIAVAALAALVALLLAGGAWLLGTESGARAAFSVAAALSGQRLQAQGVQGRLAGPLQAERLVIEAGEQTITVRKLRLDWDPWALRQRQLHLRALEIGRLDIAGGEPQQQEPPHLPSSLALPLTLRADRIAVGSGEVSHAQRTMLELGPVDLMFDYDGERYRLDLRRLALRPMIGAQAVTLDPMNVTGEATLAARQPFDLQARLDVGGGAALGEQALQVAGPVRIDGSLDRMSAATELTLLSKNPAGEASKALLSAQAALRPFAPQPLGALRLDGDALDLSAFGKGLPQTGLHLALTMAEDGAGRLTLENPAAGAYDKGRLPLASLNALFAREAESIRVEQLTAVLGSKAQPAGTLQGGGRYAPQGAAALEATLALQSVDLKKLDTRLRATHLSGTIELRDDLGQAPARQELKVDLTEPFKDGKLALKARGVRAGDDVTLEQAELRLGKGRIEASGRLALSGRQAFAATGTVSRFRPRDLGRFSGLPDILLNSAFQFEGERQPELAARLSFDIHDSRIDGRPLQGEGKLSLQAENLDIARLRLIAGSNRLSAAGQLSASGGELSFSLAAPEIGQLAPSLAGRVQADGKVSGSFMRPRIEVAWSANRLRVGERLRVDAAQGKANVRIDRASQLLLEDAALEATIDGVRAEQLTLAALRARLQFAPRPDAPLALSVSAKDLRAGKVEANTLSVDASGTTARHALQAALNEQGQQFRLEASGGLADLQSAPRWQGRLDAFTATGRLAAKLEQPAPLRLSREEILLEEARLDAPAGRLVVERFLRNPQGIASRGSAQRVRVAELLAFAGPEPALSTDLQLSGEWDIQLGDMLEGGVKLRRDSGDIVVQGDKPIALGLRTLAAELDAAAGQLALHLHAEGQRVGRIEASGKVGMAGARGAIAPGPEAPLSADVRIDIPSLAWIGPLLSPTLIADGQLQGTLAVAGTVGEPRLSGRIRGDKLRAQQIDVGVDLRNGTLDGEFRDTRAILHALRFSAPDGELVVSGNADLSGGQPIAQAAIKATRFPLLDRSDRKLRISGDSRIAWQGGSGKVSGGFVVDSGSIDLGSGNTPRLSDDVVIAGGDSRRAEKGANARKGLPAEIDVRVGMGDGIKLHGRGINGKLVGELRLVSEVGEQLRAVGELRIVDGTFSAYGRELAIEKGILHFNGPLDNPQLDILAMRRGQEVEAGVAVVGTVLEPRVTLVSDPSVSDADKLSWLVLGHGLSDSSGTGDATALQSAAASLLSKGAAAGLQSQIASALGLDKFSIGNAPEGGSLQERIVTVGKQISSRLYVSFERGLETASSIVNLRYRLSRKLTLEVQAGTQSALSIFYNLSFD